MTKRDLRTLDLSDFDDTWIKNNSGWIWPQLVSLFAELPLTRQDGVISPSQTLSGWSKTFKTDSQKWKEWWNLVHKPRAGVLMGSQNHNPRWSVGVPIILSSFLEHRGVSYSSWDWTDPLMETIIGDQLYQSYKAVVPIWTIEELLGFRDLGLRVKTGAKAGTNRTLTSYLPWGGVQDPEFKALPTLSKYMITQTWIYHPSVRHKFMICDWNNVDTLPPPLVHQDVLDTKQTKARVSTDFDEIFNL